MINKNNNNKTLNKLYKYRIENKNLLISAIIEEAFRNEKISSFRMGKLRVWLEKVLKEMAETIAPPNWLSYLKSRIYGGFIREKQIKLIRYLIKAEMFIQFVIFNNKSYERYCNIHNLSELELELSKLKKLIDIKFFKPEVQDIIKIRLLIMKLLTNLKKVKRKIKKIYLFEILKITQKTF